MCSQSGDGGRRLMVIGPNPACLFSQARRFELEPTWGEPDYKCASVETRNRCYVVQSANSKASLIVSEVSATGTTENVDTVQDR